MLVSVKPNTEHKSWAGSITYNVGFGYDELTALSGNPISLVVGIPAATQESDADEGSTSFYTSPNMGVALAC
jgi:hypothetical protein